MPGSISDLRKRQSQPYTGKKPWWARYKGPDGKVQSKTFRTRSEGDDWLVEQAAAIQRDEWVNPRDGKTPFQEYAEAWRLNAVHKESTTSKIESNFRLHVYPVIGKMPLSSIRNSDIKRLIKVMSATLGPATVGNIHVLVSGVFAQAIRDRIINQSPCTNITLPQKNGAKDVLTFEQVAHVACNINPRWHAAVLLGSSTGLRPAELFGLTVDRVNFLGRTLKVDRQMITPPKGSPHFAPPKTVSSNRTLALDDGTLAVLSEHLQTYGANDDGLFFSWTDGSMMRRQRIAEAWNAAAADLEFDDDQRDGFHALRHFHASVLIKSGRSVKVVQERLGHASPVETLKTYTHLWKEDEDETRAIANDTLETILDLLAITTDEPLRIPERITRGRKQA